MKNVERIIDIKLPKGQTAFLWGARKTGKTTYLKKRFPRGVVFNIAEGMAACKR